MLDGLPNCFSELAPEASKYAHIVRVLDTQSRQLQIIADLISQKVVCFV
jgi:hypothetical protein